MDEHSPKILASEEKSHLFHLTTYLFIVSNHQRISCVYGEIRTQIFEICSLSSLNWTEINVPHDDFIVNFVWMLFWMYLQKQFRISAVLIWSPGGFLFWLSIKFSYWKSNKRTRTCSVFFLPTSKQINTVINTNTVTNSHVHWFDSQNDPMVIIAES